MEEMLKQAASYVALGVEAVAVLIVAYGALRAVIELFWLRPDPAQPFARRKTVYVRFGAWLLLGLEFELAADIVRSVISPSWRDIGQLAAIAIIRTFLNYFLEKDVEKSAEPERQAEEVVRIPEAAARARA